MSDSKNDNNNGDESNEDFVIRSSKFWTRQNSSSDEDEKDGSSDDDSMIKSSMFWSRKNSSSSLKSFSSRDDGADTNIVATATTNIQDFSTPPRTPSPLREGKEGYREMYLSNNPDIAWDSIKSKQKFNKPKTMIGKPYDPSKFIRVVFMSDTHGSHRKIFVPKGDILIHGGDFTRLGEMSIIEDLSNYFGELQQSFKEIICIAGNHELTFDEDHYYRHNKKVTQRREINDNQCICKRTKEALRNCVYLEDQSHFSYSGLNIYGSPTTPFFHDWAFNVPRGTECLKKWKQIPSETDILITHGPPLGRHDYTRSKTHAGCYDLLNEVQNRIKPIIHVFGHIHEDHGYSFDGATLFINASSVSLFYKPVNHCVVVDIPLDYKDKNNDDQVIVVQPSSDMTAEELIDWMKDQHLAHKIQSDLLIPYFQALLKESNGDVERIHIMKRPINGSDMLSESHDTLCYRLKIQQYEHSSVLKKAMALFYTTAFQ